MNKKRRNKRSKTQFSRVKYMLKMEFDSEKLGAKKIE
jgi:hypothetical protein